ncbi:MAG: eL32 family ribosomal protein [archaeon]
MKKKFLRRNWREYKRLGRGRKKKQKWRRPKGRHAKMREKVRGRPGRPSIGLKKRVSINQAIRVNSIKQAKTVSKNKNVILCKMGKNKKIEISKIAQEKGYNILNLNINKLIKYNSKNKEKISPKIKDKMEKKK